MSLRSFCGPLAAVLLVLFSASTLLAHDGHDGAVGGGAVVVELNKAHDAFHGSAGPNAAKAILVALAQKLETDPTPSNKWIQQRVNAIVLSVNGGHVEEAEGQLHELIAQLGAATTLTKPVLKAQCMQFHNVLHAGGADAAKKCAAAIQAYATTLAPDTSALSQWAQGRFTDMLAAFTAGNTDSFEARLHAMISQL